MKKRLTSQYSSKRTDPIKLTITSHSIFLRRLQSDKQSFKKKYEEYKIFNLVNLHEEHQRKLSDQIDKLSCNALFSCLVSKIVFLI